MSDEIKREAAALVTGVDAASLSILMQGSNGDNVFSNDKALYGYVSASEFLVIPKSFDDGALMNIKVSNVDKDLPKITLKEFGGVDHIKARLGTSGDAYRTETAYLYYDQPFIYAQIALMNYAKLRNGGCAAIDAFLCASLRARWCVLGAYNITKSDGNLPYNEICVIDQAKGEARKKTPGTKDPKAIKSIDEVLQDMAAADDLAGLLAIDIVISKEYLGYMNNDEVGAKWIVSRAETLWASQEYYVRTRGHHFKDDYIVGLEKFIDASFEGDGNVPKNIALATLYRTSIHAFGLKALPIMAGHWASYGKLGNAAILRFGSAPNGMAVVTTTSAAIRSMASEPWFGQFKMVYQSQLDELFECETKILSNKFGYHMSARIYGVQPINSMVVGGRSISIDQVKQIGSAMATIGQGFIDAMKDAVKNGSISTFSFSNAKALEKHAGTAPLTTLRIKNLILYAIDSIANSKDVSSAIQAAMPKTKNKIKKEEGDDEAS